MSTTAITLYNGTVDDLLMQAEAYGVQVSTTNHRMLVTASGTAVGKIPDMTLVGKVAAMCTGLMRTLGIHKDLDEFAQAEFMGYLQRNFPTMTLADVVQAFEFFILGELDKLLPRDAEGNCAHKHYQAFAPVFYVPILKAYRKKQGEAKKELGDRVTLRIAEAKREDRDPLEVVIDQIDRLKKITLRIVAGDYPVYVIDSTAEWALRKIKLIPDAFDMTDEDLAEGMGQVIRYSDSSTIAYIRHVMRKVDVVPKVVWWEARMKAIRRVFTENATALGPAEVERRFNWLTKNYRDRIPANWLLNLDKTDPA